MFFLTNKPLKNNKIDFKRVKYDFIHINKKNMLLSFKKRVK